MKITLIKKIFPFSIFLIALAPLINGLFFKYSMFIREEHYMYFAGSILSLLAIIYLLKQQSITISFNITDILLICFIVFIYIQYYFFYTEIYSTLSIYNFIFWCLFYFVTKIGFEKVFKTDQENIVTQFIFLFFLICVFQIVYGFLQLINLLPNLSTAFNLGGSFGNPGLLAIYIGTFVPFALGCFLFSTNKTLKYFSLATFLLAIGLLPFTLSRTSWVSSFIGCLYILNHKFNLLGYFKSLSIKRRYKTVITLCLTLCVAAIIVNLYNLNTSKKRSSEGRILIWKISKDIIADNLLFGVGIDNFVSFYNTYQADYFKKGLGTEEEKLVAGKVPYAFNDYLQTLIETGLVGFALFVLLLLSAFWPNRNDIHQKENHIVPLARSSLLTIIIAAFFAYPFQVIPELVLFYILLAIISANQTNKKIELRLSKVKTVFLTVILLSLTCYFEYFYANQYIASIHWTKSIHAYENNKNDESKIHYDKAVSDLYNNTYFCYNYANWLYLNKRYNEALENLNRIKDKLNARETYTLLGDIYMATGEYKKAEEAYIYTTNLYPSLFIPNHQLFRTYILMGKTEDAKNMAKKIVNMNTKILSPDVQQIKLEMIKYLSEE